MTEPQLDAQGEAHEVLCSAVADFGQRVLSDPGTLRGRISDPLADLPRERDLLITAAEADVVGELTQYIQEQRLDPDTAVQLVSRSLTDRKSIDPASSAWVTREYAQALGYGVGPAAPPPPPSPQFAPAPEPTVISYPPSYGLPSVQTAPPPAAPTIAPGGYPSYSAPQAPAGDPAYTAPPPRVGDGAYAPTQVAGGFAPPRAPGAGGYAPGAGGYAPGAGGYAPGAGGSAPPQAPGTDWYAPTQAPGTGGYAPTQAPGTGGYAPTQAPGTGGYAPTQAPGTGGYAPTQAPGAGQVPAGTPPQGSPSWVQPTAPPKRRKRWPLFTLIAVAVLGLTAGLFVWAPWHKYPVTPVAVRGQSPTATSVLVSWSPGRGGATIDRYLILRDGTRAGSVPAGQTSYLDSGLAPGTTHRYKVIAESGTQQSPPSVSIAVRTITPSPIGLTVGQATWTSVQFHWSPPPNSPAPSGYAIVVNGAPGVTLPGSTTSYNDTGLQLATSYQYQVVAMWGSQQSSRSSVLAITTLAAPLQGSAPLQVKTLTTPGSGASLSVGEKWSDSWSFTPTCTANGCTLKVVGEWAPPNYKTVPFTINLTNSGGWYVGSNTAYISSCGSVSEHNTVSLRITADNGADNKGAWSSWHGTWVVSSPYTTENSTYYCAAQSWTFSLTGTY